MKQYSIVHAKNASKQFEIILCGFTLTTATKHSLSFSSITLYKLDI